MKMYFKILICLIIIVFIFISFFYLQKPRVYGKDSLNWSYCTNIAFLGGIDEIDILNNLNALNNDRINYQSDKFWALIALENHLFNQKQNFEKNTNTINNAFNILIALPPKNSFESILMSQNRIRYFKNRLNNEVLLNNVFPITNYEDKYQLPLIMTNAEFGSGEDAFYLYTYYTYKKNDKKLGLIWLEMAAENDFHLAKILFADYLSKKNSNLYNFYLINDIDKDFGSNTLLDNRRQFWLSDTSENIIKMKKKQVTSCKVLADKYEEYLHTIDIGYFPKLHIFLMNR